MPDDKIKKSLKYSIFDGTFYSMMVGFGENFLSAFATFLKATSTELGLIGSLPLVFGSMSQLFTNKLLKIFKSRKRFVLAGAGLQGLMYLLFAFTFFLGKISVILLIFFVCLYWVLGSIIAPAWNSWMGDIVDEKKRGAYFGKRNRITGFASFFALLLGGYILQAFTSGMHQYLGFLVIFGLALLSRIGSFIYLLKQFEPAYYIEPEINLNIIDFVKKARYHDFELFVIFMCLMNLAVYIGAPFFAAYMLYDLKLSYGEYTIVLAASLVVKYIATSIWGKAGDRFGTRKVLSLSCILMPFVPIVWLFGSSLWYLILIQMFNGFVWAGFEIASLNYLYDITGPQKRATAFSYYNVFNGMGIFFGGLIGSVIVGNNKVFWSIYLLVFLISGIARGVVALLLLPHMKEERAVEHIPYARLLFNVVSPFHTIGVIKDFIQRKGKKADEDISEWD